MPNRLERDPVGVAPARWVTCPNQWATSVRLALPDVRRAGHPGCGGVREVAQFRTATRLASIPSLARCAPLPAPPTEDRRRGAAPAGEGAQRRRPAEACRPPHSQAGLRLR